MTAVTLFTRERDTKLTRVARVQPAIAARDVHFDRAKRSWVVNALSIYAYITDGSAQLFTDGSGNLIGYGSQVGTIGIEERNRITNLTRTDRNA